MRISPAATGGYRKTCSPGTSGFELLCLFGACRAISARGVQASSSIYCLYSRLPLCWLHHAVRGGSSTRDFARAASATGGLVVGPYLPNRDTQVPLGALREMALQIVRFAGMYPPPRFSDHQAMGNCYHLPHMCRAAGAGGPLPGLSGARRWNIPPPPSSLGVASFPPSRRMGIKTWMVLSTVVGSGDCGGGDVNLFQLRGAISLLSTGGLPA